MSCYYDISVLKVYPICLDIGQNPFLLPIALRGNAYKTFLSYCILIIVQTYVCIPTEDSGNEFEGKTTSPPLKNAQTPQKPKQYAP